jgi:hypothetical protein
MKRTLVVAIALLALPAAAWPSLAWGQSKPSNQLLANATVKSVSATSVTVTANGKDTTFTVDSKTNVVGRGIGTKSRAKGGKPTIPDLLKEGDRVTVTYHDAGGTMHASKIEVSSKSATP